MARKTKKAKDMVTVTQRAAKELKSIQAANAKEKHHVLRIDIEGDGYSLWLGPEQKEDTIICGKDTVLLRATPDVTSLFKKTSMVIDFMDHEDGPRLIVHPEDDPPPELSKSSKASRAARKPGKTRK